VANPTNPHAGDRLNTSGGTRGALDDIQHLRIHRVHQAPPHLDRGVLEYEQNHQRDTEAHERVGLGEPEPDAGDANKDGQRGETVDARVAAIRNKGSAADSVAGANAVLGNELVADTANERGDGHGQ